LVGNKTTTQGAIKKKPLNMIATLTTTNKTSELIHIFNTFIFLVLGRENIFSHVTLNTCTKVRKSKCPGRL
jgi:hypothetical protein